MTQTNKIDYENLWHYDDDRHHHHRCQNHTDLTGTSSKRHRPKPNNCHITGHTWRTWAEQTLTFWCFSKKKKGESCWSIEKLINNALSSELLIPTTHLFFFKQVYEVSFLTADFSLTCDHLSAVSHAQIILAHRYQVHCELYCVSTDAFHNKTTSYSLKISPNHQNLTSCPVTESCSSRDIKLQIKWSIRANSPGPGPGPGPGPDNLPSESGPPTAPARINRCWSPALCCLHAPAVQRLTSELTANAHRCDQQTPQIQWTAPPSTSTHTQLLIHRQIRAHSPG